MNINKTSLRSTFRTQGRFTVQTGETHGGYRVYPVYLTTDLEALAEHPLFWDDPTLDYNIRTVAAIYVPTSGSVGEMMTIETFTWAHEADNFGELLDALEMRMTPWNVN